MIMTSIVSNTKMIKLIKNSGMYKDFGKPFFKVGLEALINYKGIIVALFWNHLVGTLLRLHNCLMHHSSTCQGQQVAKNIYFNGYQGSYLSCLPTTFNPLKLIILIEFYIWLCNLTILLDTNSLKT